MSALRLLRRLLSGEPDAAFAFRPAAADDAADAKRAPLPATAGPTDFYVHVPYCRNRCAYCPYNTLPLDAAAVPGFYAALLAEARRVARSGATCRGRSLYVGGGTPTCTGDALPRFLRDFATMCGAPATIAVETSPAELAPRTLDALRSAGVTQLSVGVQSFNPDILKSLGRTGATRAPLPDFTGFRNVNIDLMYNPEAETLEQLGDDLHRALDTDADQITVYPLFRFFARGGVVMPPLRARRRFYALVWRELAAAGFSPVSVWSFRRGDRDGEAFSSVQRRRFVGLGPGAATMRGDLFAFNTFDEAAWRRRVSAGRSAWSLEMPLSPNLRALYDLYWDLYACRLPRELSRDLTRRGLLRLLASLARRIGGFCRGERLTERGAYWIHLLQNHYILDYINRVWSVSKSTPFPPALAL